MSRANECAAPGCHRYLPASVRKAGKDLCGGCERQLERDRAANDRIVGLIDALDAQHVADSASDAPSANDNDQRDAGYDANDVATWGGR